jgi:hypothetical protein
MSAKKPVTSNKKVICISDRAIWTTLPSMVNWLQQDRNKIKTLAERMEFDERNRGINATIVLLSAVCLEGFLVECLNTFIIGSRFASQETFEGRLDHAFLKRVSRATFKEFPELFTLTLGKPLEEAIDNKPLIDGVRLLFNFRNGIAHARSVIYQTYAEDLEDDVDYEIENQYKALHEYLGHKKLIYRNDDLFKNIIADHFAGFVKPYIDAVVPLLPEPQSDNVKILVALAYNSKIK